MIQRLFTIQLPFTLTVAMLVSFSLSAVPRYDPSITYQVALPGDENTPPASIREHSIAWHPPLKCYYLIADVVSLENPHHPNTYETALHLWRSPDLSSWTYLGVAVPVGKEGRFDAHGASSPAGMVFRSGKLYVAYSGRKTERFTERGIGLAWSGSNPDKIPWTTTALAISDPPGEDDDPGLLSIPGDSQLHCYHRTTGGAAGYRIVHSTSTTPEDPDSWRKATDVTQRPDGVRAQEMTGVAWLDDRVHLFVIEQGAGVKGIQIAHLVSDKAEGPFTQFDPARRYVENQPKNLAYGGHFTPVVRDDRMVATFWTMFQEGKRYGLQGHPIVVKPNE
ncbi:MAG: hypothetical protein L3K26_02180 [Candidatus Hydrogenedentes bacterium]|nr:hypothetical protein [Candidatus Hydrogenedentota bacterium]